MPPLLEFPVLPGNRDEQKQAVDQQRNTENGQAEEEDQIARLFTSLILLFKEIGSHSKPHELNMYVG